MARKSPLRSPSAVKKADRDATAAPTQDGTQCAFGLQDEAPVIGFNPWTLAVQDELKNLARSPDEVMTLTGAVVEVRRSTHSLWLIVRWCDARLAFRAAFSPTGGIRSRIEFAAKDELHIQCKASFGQFDIKVAAIEPGLSLLRVTTVFTPKATTRFPWWPRDLCMVDEEGNPGTTRGIIHAAQRGSAAGMLFVTETRPKPATFFYLQNLTWLNAYAQTTETELNTVVGGNWPDIGYRPPSSTDRALTAGESINWSDAIMSFHSPVPRNEGDRARSALASLADVYRHLPPPATVYRDWPGRARETLTSLESPSCWTEDLGHPYLLPYVQGEHPDSMVQTVLIPPLLRYRHWLGEDVPLIEKLREGIPEFYDANNRLIGRYLPTIGKEKNPEEVDSWYLYHPLINLAHMASHGDECAADLLRKGLDFAVKAARHFNYHWPVKFNLRTMFPTKAKRKPGEPGQTDVPGLYAYLMLNAAEVLNTEWYREEAKRSLQQMRSLDFSIGYQFNNCAWGAVACAKLWRESGEQFYLDISHCLLANIFHNVILWEPDYSLTRGYSMFMALTCLHDGNYSAMFEEYETFSAFREYLQICEDDIPPGLELLMTEYGKFLLSRGWYYYPSELSAEVLAEESRSGQIDRSLAIPLEDLYPERQRPGTVGQEIYGSGAAFEFTRQAYTQIGKAPAHLFCEYPVSHSHTGSRSEFEVCGDPRMSCRMRLIPHEPSRLSDYHLRLPKGADRGSVKDGQLDFQVFGGSKVIIECKNQKQT